MPKVSFVLGVHCHQPLGNFDHIIEGSYHRCYLPFLHALKEHPTIPVSLHYSGILWDWLEGRHPEFLEIVAELVEKGQVELLTGGYYEPILPILPDHDKQGQIEKLSSYLRKRFGCQPRGMWLAERVWEPHLAKPLAEAGVEYVALDDYHFKAAGLAEEELRGYYLTEEQGYLLKAFPISKELRYFIPFAEPERTIELLRAQASEEGRLLVMADDGEKFGVWPGTHELVYRQGWLHRFFSLLEENQEWLFLTTFSGALDRYRPLGRIYLPTASYAEMMEWALPSMAVREYESALGRVESLPDPESVRRFLRGGFWRNFLVKYPEANHLHKRVLAVGDKIRLLAGGEGLIRRAQEELWRAQCNDAYWHGIFGGLYLPHLRRALYSALIRAEALADSLRHLDEKAWVELERRDIDGDGNEEVFLNTTLLSLLFHLGEGGGLVELDYKPRTHNLLDTLARRPEGYHFKLTSRPGLSGGTEEVRTIHAERGPKEGGLEALLHYDWHRRASFLDHFLGQSADLEGFRRSAYEESGDFVNQGYQVQTLLSEGRAEVTLFREGHLWIPSGPLPLEVRKSFSITGAESSVPVRYRLTNRSRTRIRVRFGVEFNLAFSAGIGEGRYLEIGGRMPEDSTLASLGESLNMDRIRLVDEWLGLEVALAFSKPATLWRFPQETISQSEAGYERVYQGTVLLPWWEVELGPGVPWELWIELGLKGDETGNNFI